MYYNKLTEGDQVAEIEFNDISADNMKIMSAIMDDSNPIHFDRKHIAELGRPGLINQGPMNLSYLTQAALSVAEAPDDIKYLESRNKANVFEGETVTAVATVDRKYIEDDDAFVELGLELIKENGTVAVSGSAIVEMTIRDPDV